MLEFKDKRLSVRQRKTLERVNRRGIQQLQEALLKSRAIAFLGAGASAPVYPVWASLISHILDYASPDLSPSELRTLKRMSSPAPDFTIEMVRERMGRGAYEKAIRDLMIGKKDSHTGRQWTATHEAVALLPFRAYVTTNLDNGLAQALTVRTPDRIVEPATWSQDQVLESWINSRILQNGTTPILYAHGSVFDPASVVLAANDYRRAYGTRLPKVIESILERDCVVWIGFSFTDSYVNAIQRRTIQAASVAADAGAPPPARHVAILPWFIGPRRDDPNILRQRAEMEFASSLILYPVFGNDHSALDELLVALRGTESPALVTSTHDRVPEKSLPGTNDEPSREAEGALTLDFSQYTQAITRLSLDDRVKIVAIYGDPGVGKSTVAGAFVKAQTSMSGSDRVFVWKFHKNIAIDDFNSALLAWQSENLSSGVTEGSETSGRDLLVLLDDLDNTIEGFLQRQNSEALHPGIERLLTDALNSTVPITVLITLRNPTLMSRFRIHATCQELEITSPARSEMLASVRLAMPNLNVGDAELLIDRIGTNPAVVASWCRLIKASDADYAMQSILNAGRGEIPSHSDKVNELSSAIEEFAAGLATFDRAVLGAIYMLQGWATPDTVASVLAIANAGNGLVDDREIDVLVRRTLRFVVDIDQNSYRVMDQLAPGVSRLPMPKGLVDACVAWLLPREDEEVDLAWGGSPSFGAKVLRAIEILIKEDLWAEANDVYLGDACKGLLSADASEWLIGLQIEMAFVGSEEKMKACRRYLGHRELDTHLMNLVEFFENLGDYRTAESFLKLAGKHVVNPEPNSRLLWACASSRIYLQLADFQAARRHLNEVHELLNHSLPGDVVSLYVGCRAAIELSEMQFGAARAYLSQLSLTIADFHESASRLSERHGLSWIALLWTRFLLSQGAIREAGEAVSLLHESASRRVGWEPELVNVLEVSSLLLARSDAVEQLEDCLTRSSELNLSETWIRSALRLSLLLDDRETARKMCADAVRLSKSRHLRLLEFYAHLYSYWSQQRFAQSDAVANLMAEAEQSLRQAKLIAEEEGFGSSLLELTEASSPPATLVI